MFSSLVKIKYLLTIKYLVIVHSNQRGREVIVGDKSHILLWEQAGAAQVIIYIYNLLFEMMLVNYLLKQIILTDCWIAITRS